MKKTKNFKFKYKNVKNMFMKVKRLKLNNYCFLNFSLETQL